MESCLWNGRGLEYGRGDYLWTNYIPNRSATAGDDYKYRVSPSIVSPGVHTNARYPFTAKLNFRQSALTVLWIIIIGVSKLDIISSIIVNWPMLKIGERR